MCFGCFIVKGKSFKSQLGKWLGQKSNPSRHASLIGKSCTKIFLFTTFISKVKKKNETKTIAVRLCAWYKKFLIDLEERTGVVANNSVSGSQIAVSLLHNCPRNHKKLVYEGSNIEYRNTNTIHLFVLLDQKGRVTFCRC